MEFTESVTGLQHETPGEVLVCQIDERYLNSGAGLKARSINAESGRATDCGGRPFNFFERPFRETERSEIQIIPAKSPLADLSLCSMSFDEANRTNSISRADASHRDE
jgi:hypothetical protein